MIRFYGERLKLLHYRDLVKDALNCNLINEELDRQYINYLIAGGTSSRLEFGRERIEEFVIRREWKKKLCTPPPSWKV